MNTHKLLYPSNYRMQSSPDSEGIEHVYQSYPVACAILLIYILIYIAFYVSIGCCLVESIHSIYSWVKSGLSSFGQPRVPASAGTHRGRSRVRALKPSHNLRLIPSPSLRLNIEFDHDADAVDAEEFIDIEMTRSMDLRIHALE